MSLLPNTLSDIRSKVRRITARPSSVQISDSEIDKYINTFYVYDMPEHLKMESLLYNYQFTTTANVPVYDLPTGTYLTAMPPVFIAGYQSYMTQSRQNFFRVNPMLNYIQSQIYTGDGTDGSGGTYTGQTLTAVPAVPGFKPNPPGAYSTWTSDNDIPATSGIAPSITLVDDGQGNLFAPTDTSIDPSAARGTINYVTGDLEITNFTAAIPTGNAINVQYIPYVASRPQSVIFFQDQFILYPIPDQAYTVSFEAYKYPTEFLGSGTATPQLAEWWQMIAVGAALKIFEDNGDLENYTKFRPLLEEYMALSLRRTIVQQTSERSATIFTEQVAPGQYNFGNLFGGF
jgi:hypothetical protein